MSYRDTLLSDRDIEASTVLPAFEASLRHGTTEEELADCVGWTRSALETTGYVSGASTYRHMELMFEKPGYAEFVLAATELHTFSSLGIVGLACKTAASVGEAIACHERFQHLINRTAQYTWTKDASACVLHEERYGDAHLGSRLISDYTMMIALKLLRTVAKSPPRVLVARSRRTEMGDQERALYEEYLGAPIELASSRASLAFDASLFESRVASADAELTAYFRGVLEEAAPLDEPLLRDVRAAIRDALVLGTPTSAKIARTLGLGQRTLQRRLAEQDQSFAQVLESTRRALAEGYLANEALSLAEVAYLLGYVEQASFFRAFKRWFGTTPALFRQALLPQV